MKAEDRKKFQNLSEKYKCSNCGKKFNAPTHCKHPMHIANVDDHLEWNCWMGASCGKSPLDAKCDNPSLLPL